MLLLIIAQIILSSNFQARNTVNIENEVIYLSKDCPVQEVNFDFFESEPKENKTIEKPKPAFYGMIFGITGGVFEHANWPVRFTKLKFENRITVSGFFSFYIIGFLEIDKTYSITASKKDYSDLTIEVTLTAKNPIQRINIFMYPDY